MLLESSEWKREKGYTMSKKEATFVSVKNLKACAKIAARSKTEGLKVVHVAKRGSEVIVEACDGYIIELRKASPTRTATPPCG